MDWFKQSVTMARIIKRLVLIYASHKPTAFIARLPSQTRDGEVENEVLRVLNCLKMPLQKADIESARTRTQTIPRHTYEKRSTWIRTGHWWNPSGETSKQ